MKTHLTLTSGLVLGLILSSPLALAQVPPPPTNPPPPPSDTPVKPEPPEAEHRENGSHHSAVVKEDRNSVGVTGDPETKAGRTRVRSGARPNEFATWDVDGDGLLTSEEAGQAFSAKGDFKAADKDGDGKLSHAEYEKAINVKKPKS